MLLCTLIAEASGLDIPKSSVTGKVTRYFRKSMFSIHCLFLKLPWTSALMVHMIPLGYKKLK